MQMKARLSTIISSKICASALSEVLKGAIWYQKV